MDLGQDKTVKEITAQLENAAGGSEVIKVEGTWGSFARCLGAYISKKISRPILFICPHIDDADKAIDDAQTFGCERIELLSFHLG